MASVSETGEKIVSSEIAKLHFNGDGGALGWTAVMTTHGTDKPTTAMHQLLAQEMASYSGVEGKVGACSASSRFWQVWGLPCRDASTAAQGSV